MQLYAEEADQVSATASPTPMLTDDIRARLVDNGVDDTHVAVVVSIAEGSEATEVLKERATRTIMAMCHTAVEVLSLAKTRAFFLWFVIGLIISGMREVFRRAGDEDWLSTHTIWKTTAFENYGLRSLQYAEELADAGPDILDYAHWGVGCAIEMKWPLRDYLDDGETGRGSSMTTMVEVLNTIKSDPQLEDLRQQAEEDASAARVLADTAGTFLMLKRPEIELASEITLDHAQRIARRLGNTLTKRQLLTLARILNDGDSGLTRLQRMQDWIDDGCELPKAGRQRGSGRVERLYEHLAKIRQWDALHDVNNPDVLRRLKCVHPEQIADIDRACEILGRLKRQVVDETLPATSAPGEVPV